MSGSELSEFQRFHVPKKVYDEALEDIHDLSVKKCDGNKCIALRCHQTSHNGLGNNQYSLCASKILEAAHQAWNDRNFKVLYEIINKGMDIESKIHDQLFEVCAA